MPHTSLPTRYLMLTLDMLMINALWDKLIILDIHYVREVFTFIIYIYHFISDYF